MRTTHRFAAGTALVCLALHVVLVGLGGRQMLAVSLPMLLLSLACASCARPSAADTLARGQAVGLGLGGTAMVLVHLVVEHGGGRAAVEPGVRIEAAHLVMHAGVTLGGVQAVMAALVLLGLSRSVR